MPSLLKSRNPSQNDAHHFGNRGAHLFEQSGGLVFDFNAVSSDFRSGPVVDRTGNAFICRALRPLRWCGALCRV
jgi:hypothetical protein